MKRLNKREIASGKWLALSELEYSFIDGSVRRWETVERKNSSGAVVIFATLQPSGEVILVRQYRPPVDACVIEFPAGLIDEHEQASTAAVRELREETGYVGKVLKVSPRAYSSPGMSDEFVHIVHMEVRTSEQGELKTDFDESEFIETFRVKPEELNLFLSNAVEKGDRIDAKVMAYALTVRA